jgi:succinate-acetate transporter protein
MSETSAEQPVPPASAIADPAPLGLAAFAMTTLILSLSNTNTWPAGIESAVALALAYGGGAQLLAGMWEFKRGNVFGATAFSSFGAFWISFWYLAAHILPNASAADVGVIEGTFLLGWCVFTFYMSIAAMRVSGAVLLGLPQRGRHRDDQGRRLVRGRDGWGGVVRILRGRHELDVRQDHSSRLPTDQIAVG